MEQQKHGWSTNYLIVKVLQTSPGKPYGFVETIIQSTINCPFTEKLTLLSPNELALLTVIRAYTQGIADGLDKVNVKYTYHTHAGDAITGTGCYTTPVFHKHIGNSSSAGGCYTIKALISDYSYGCGGYQSHTIPLDNGLYQCGCGCQAGLNDNCRHRGPKYGYKVSCNKTESTVERYDLGCGKTESTIETATIHFN